MQVFAGTGFPNARVAAAAAAAAAAAESAAAGGEARHMDTIPQDAQSKKKESKNKETKKCKASKLTSETLETGDARTLSQVHSLSAVGWEGGGHDTHLGYPSHDAFIGGIKHDWKGGARNDGESGSGGLKALEDGKEASQVSEPNGDVMVVNGEIVDESESLRVCECVYMNLCACVYACMHAHAPHAILH